MLLLGCVAAGQLASVDTSGTSTSSPALPILDVAPAVRVVAEEDNQHHATIVDRPDGFALTWQDGLAWQDATVARAVTDVDGAAFSDVPSAPVTGVSRPDVFGDDVALWNTWQASDPRIALVALDAQGAPVGPEVSVSEPDEASFEQAGPDGAVLAQGDVVVLWAARYDLAPHALYRWRRMGPDGTPFGPPVDLEPSTAHHSPPDVAALPDGGWVATWEVAEATWRNVRLGRWSAEGVLDRAVDVLPESGTWETRPMVAVSDTDAVAVAWYDSPPDPLAPRGARLAVVPPDDWTPSCDVVVGTEGLGEQPVVAWHGDVVWVAWQETASPGTADIWLQAFLDCVPLDLPVQVDGASPGLFEERPALAMTSTALAVTFESHLPGVEDDARLWAAFGAFR